MSDTVTDTLIYETVKSVLDEADLESLLKMGCPDDEYDPESKMIAQEIGRFMGIKRVMPIPSSREIGYIISYVMHGYFHETWTPVVYFPRHAHLGDEISRRLAEAMRKQGKPNIEKKVRSAT